MDNKLMKTDNPNEYVMRGSNGIKYVVKKVFADDKNKNLQDILVDYMLSVNNRPKNDK